MAGSLPSPLERGLAAAGDVLGDGAPEALLLVQHPVHQRLDGGVDALSAVGDDAALEVGAQPVGVEEVEDSAEAQRLVEEVVGAVVQFVDHVGDFLQAVREVPPHVLLVQPQLALDLVRALQVGLEHLQPGAAVL